MKPGKITREYLLAACILLLCACGFLYKPLFVNHNIVPFDIIGEFDSMAPEKVKAQNYLLSDVMHQFYPSAVFAKQELASGRIPWTNPHQFGGIAFFSDPQNRIAEFTRLLLLPFPISAETTMLFSALLTLALTGFFMYGFLRSCRFSALIAYAGAIAWMFSGPMAVWLQYPLVSTALWIPCVIWALTRIIRDRNPKFYVLLGVGIFFQALGGQPQMLAIALLLYVAYSTLLLGQQPKPRLKIGVWPLSVILLAIGASAFLLGPATKFIQSSPAYAQGRGLARTTAHALFSDYTSHPLATVKTFAKRVAEFGVTAVLPNYFGNPLTRNYRFPEQNSLLNYSEMANYGGLAVILLAVGSFFLFRKRTVRFWLGVAAISFALAARLPGFDFSQYLPLLGKINFGRLRFLFVFSAIMLACLVMNHIQKRLVPKWQYIIGVVFVFACAIDLWIAFSGYNPGADPNLLSQFKQSSAVSALTQNANGRVLGIGKPGSSFRAPLIPNMATALGLNDLRGSNPVVTQQIEDFAKAHLDYKGSYILASSMPDDATLNQASVGTIICETSQCEIAFPHGGWIQTFSNASVSIYTSQTPQHITPLTQQTKPTMLWWIVISSVSGLGVISACTFQIIVQKKTKPLVRG